MGETHVRNPVLESLICSEVDNEPIKLVYGDWLQARDNPWGELIALQHALLGPAPRFEWDDPPAWKASLSLSRDEREQLYYAATGWMSDQGRAAAKHRPGSEREQELRDQVLAELVPDGFEGEPENAFILGWHAGFIQRAFLPQYGGLRDSLDDGLIRLLEHPVAMALEELVLGEIEWHGGGPRSLHYEPEIEVIAVLAPPRLRRLVLGAWDSHDVSWTASGDLSLLTFSLPGLRELELQAGYVDLGGPGDLEFPELRKLLVRSGGLDERAIHAVATSRLPKLESLTLWFGTPDYGGVDNAAFAAPFLDGERFDTVRELGLCNAMFTDDLCPLLIDSTILAQLDVLDLSMGTLSADGARALLAAKDKLAHLERIDLRANGLAPATAERLAEALPNTDVRFQKPAQRGRYVSVSE